MSRRKALKIMQKHVGSTVLVLNLCLDEYGDWIGDLVIGDDYSEPCGFITFPDHGRCKPLVYWE